MLTMTRTEVTKRIGPADATLNQHHPSQHVLYLTAMYTRAPGTEGMLCCVPSWTHLGA